MAREDFMEKEAEAHLAGHTVEGLSAGKRGRLIWDTANNLNIGTWGGEWTREVPGS